MSYENLLAAQRIRPLDLDPDRQQARIAELLSVAERELQDAEIEGRSLDGVHNSAYEAARTIAEAIMTAEGYRRGRGEGQHVIVFEFLKLVADGRFAAEADLFGRARKLRNETTYERAGIIGPSAAAAILEASKAFLAGAREWLPGAEREEEEGE